MCQAKTPSPAELAQWRPDLIWSTDFNGVAPMNHDCACAELMASKYLTCYNPFFSLDFADRHADRYSLSGLDADAYLASLPEYAFPGE